MPAETIERSAFSDAPASIARKQTEIDEDNGKHNVRLYSRSISWGNNREPLGGVAVNLDL
jgi:hypothetical protein